MRLSNINSQHLQINIPRKENRQRADRVDNGQGVAAAPGVTHMSAGIGALITPGGVEGPVGSLAALGLTTIITASNISWTSLHSEREMPQTHTRAEAHTPGCLLR